MECTGTGCPGRLPALDAARFRVTAPTLVRMAEPARGPNLTSGERPTLTAPPAARAIALAGLFVLSLGFLFASYCIARGLVGTFSPGPSAIALCVASTAAASIFLWWLVPFADFAEIFWIHLPADRRSARGQCPHCGYPHEGRPQCSECGRETSALPAWTLGLRPVRRLAWILVPALLLGCAAGEAWSRLDESLFIAESRGAAYRRPRAFPAGFATMSVDAAGRYASEAWPEDERDRTWRSGDESRRERGLGWKARADEQAAREQAAREQAAREQAAKPRPVSDRAVSAPPSPDRP